MPSLKKQRALERYRKKLRRGNRGFPVATVAFYGPDNRTATKVVVSLVTIEGGEVSNIERWASDRGIDLRKDMETADRIVSLLESWNPKSVISPDQIIGCPHEEGIDYPEGGKCPKCPYWANRDRWSGEVIH